nr:unnamed protein product [Callosobruchus chinensis]
MKIISRKKYIIIRKICKYVSEKVPILSEENVSCNSFDQINGRVIRGIPKKLVNFPHRIGIVFHRSMVINWNEGRAVHHAHSLDETYNSAITLSPYEGLRPSMTVEWYTSVVL